MDHAGPDSLLSSHQNTLRAGTAGENSVLSRHLDFLGKLRGSRGQALKVQGSRHRRRRVRLVWGGCVALLTNFFWILWSQNSIFWSWWAENRTVGLELWFQCGSGSKESDHNVELHWGTVSSVVVTVTIFIAYNCQWKPDFNTTDQNMLFCGVKNQVFH